LSVRASGLTTAPVTQADTAPPPCLIVNPRSFRASRKGLAARATALALAYGAEVVEADHPSSVDSALRSILSRRQRYVLVLSGDGTVHAIVDALARLPEGSWKPDLLVLPGGRTNLTAADLKPQGETLAVLERALRHAREPHCEMPVEERHTLCVEQAPAPPRYGFFVGAALVDDVVRECQQFRLRGSRLRSGHLSTFWCLLQLGLSAMLGRPRLPPRPTLDVDAGATGCLSAPTSVLIATTLEHRVGWFNPYAARGAGTLRVTVVKAGAPGFWRGLPGILTGRFTKAMTLENGYLSGRCPHLQISGLRGYSLDGEGFDADPARPLSISPGPILRFLQP